LALEQQSLELPQSLAMEKAVLGAVLHEHNNFLSVSLKLKSPEFFFLASHQRIYQSMFSLDQENKPIDIHMVRDQLRLHQTERDHEIPITFLLELLEAGLTTVNLNHYVELIRRDYYLRRIIQVCQKTVQKAIRYDETQIELFVEQAEKEFLDISHSHETGGLRSASDILIPTLEELEKKLKNDEGITGVPSGFTDLDAITAGWQSSDLVILAARPGMGKTALALNCAMNAAKQGRHVAIFTLEMSQNQLMLRLLASEARVDSSRLRKGILDEEEQDRLMQGARQIHNLPAKLSIDETPAITLTEIRSRCRRFKKEHKLELVIIDYLQLMGTNHHRRDLNREREISEISIGLKGLAKELDISVMALAQLNRGPDSRPDKRPKLNDLRESGSIEQDADLILFIYRDDYYHKNSEQSGKAEIILGKNRHGPTTTLSLAYLPNFVSFHNLLPEG